MATKALIVYGERPFLHADDSANKNTVAMRDGSGDLYAAVHRSSGGIVNGGRTELGIASKTADYTLAATETTCFVDATSGAVTITMPVATAAGSRLYIINKTDSGTNAVTVKDSDGTTTLATLSSQHDSALLQSDGSNWQLHSFI